MEDRERTGGRDRALRTVTCEEGAEKGRRGWGGLGGGGRREIKKARDLDNTGNTWAMDSDRASTINQPVFNYCLHTGLVAANAPPFFSDLLSAAITPHFITCHTPPAL